MIKGVIFDMDGVVTNTAIIHFKAWKTIIDDLLFKINPSQCIPFTEKEYFYYLDGMPRVDGLKNFLNSRAISLSEIQDLYQDINDCIKEICLKKNDLLLNLLANNKVEAFQDALDFIKFLSSLNYPIALISSSKNCLAILKSAGIDTLFPIIIDGIYSEQLGFSGKPQPDIFLEAARRLNLPPQECMIIEDALAGVQAAKTGNFGAIIALDRKNKLKSEFEKLGADYIISDLSSQQILLYEKLDQLSQKNHPNALSIVPLLTKLIDHQYEFIVFLDYDGTLTPIVERPENALLSTTMQECITTLSQQYLTVIISGRELSNLKKLVNIPNIYYSGNHGFELEGPENSGLFYQIGHEYINDLTTLYQNLNDTFKNIKGCIVENKKFSLSIHYRLVDENLHEFISQKIDDLLEIYPQLVRHSGKKVFEVRPNINWNKGIAAVTILNQLKKKNSKLIPIYIGDDVTDEDAFVQFSFTGLTIKVSSELQKSHANYFLNSPQEVHKFLNYLNQFKEESYESMDSQLSEV